MLAEVQQAGYGWTRESAMATGIPGYVGGKVGGKVVVCRADPVSTARHSGLKDYYYYRGG